MGRVREQEPEGFPAFWDIWRPNMRPTDGRGDARTAYRKHILMGAEPADIIDGAKAFLRNLADKDRPYIPLAASWINKESYVDWCESERTYQARLDELRAKRDASADRTNVHVLQQPAPQAPDNRPSEAERAAQVAAAKQRLGMAAQG